MILPLALPAALFLLVADPIDQPDYVPQTLAPAEALPTDQARTLALQLGHTIGVAMECATGQDLDGIEAQAEHQVDEAATNAHEDPMELEDRFHDAMAEGRDQVLDNQADCNQAKADLQKMQGQTHY
jgi:hypothetical protein